MDKRNSLLCLGAMTLWILFIFCRSIQPADVSAAESQQALDLLGWLVPWGLSMHLVRKLGHFLEFAVLGALAGALFGDRCRRAAAGWLYAVMTGAATALCDETIQLFVPGRNGQIPDIWLDAAGTCTGAAVALIILALRRRRPKQDS